MSNLAYTLIALAIILLTVILKFNFPYPTHASCLLRWEFEEPCVFVIQRLRSQIIKSHLYKMRQLVPRNNTIHALHVLLKNNAVDNIDITFTDSTDHSCTAFAESYSKTWYTLFDNGRNYCNLHNLIVEADFYNDNNCLEYTNNALCTQYDMAHCI